MCRPLDYCQFWFQYRLVYAFEHGIWSLHRGWYNHGSVLGEVHWLNDRGLLHTLSLLHWSDNDVCNTSGALPSSVWRVYSYQTVRCVRVVHHHFPDCRRWPFHKEICLRLRISTWLRSWKYHRPSNIRCKGRSYILRKCTIDLYTLSTTDNVTAGQIHDAGLLAFHHDPFGFIWPYP